MWIFGAANSSASQSVNTKKSIPVLRRAVSKKRSIHSGHDPKYGMKITTDGLTSWDLESRLGPLSPAEHVFHKARVLNLGIEVNVPRSPGGMDVRAVLRLGHFDERLDGRTDVGNLRIWLK